MHRLELPTTLMDTISIPKLLIVIPVCHYYDYSNVTNFPYKTKRRGSDQLNRSKLDELHMSGPNVNRVAAVRDTWVTEIAVHSPHVGYKFFYGRGKIRGEKADEVFVDVGDSYAELPAKVCRAVQCARDGGYEWVYKCDDDTWAWPDRLIRDIMSPDWAPIEYYGFRHQRGYINGGPGYILGPRAMGS